MEKAESYKLTDSKVRILITGGFGQIGSHVIDELLKVDDVKILCIDNLATGRLFHLPSDENLTIIKGSIDNRSLVDRIFKKFSPTCVIHTAASYKEPNNWYDHNMTNILGSVNLIQASIENKVTRFIYLNTGLCYQSSENPHLEDEYLDPKNSSYAITKTSAEYYLELSNLNYVSFRLSNILGPRNLVGPLPIFYERLKNGQQCFVTNAIRDFVHVEDLVGIIMSATFGTGRGIYNFASDKRYTIKNLYDKAVDVLGIRPYPEPLVKSLGSDHVDVILLNSRKLKKDFKIETFKSLDRIVEDAFAYYSKNGTEGEISHLILN